MKFSLEWLSELSGIPRPSADPAEALTRSGLAVDAVEGAGPEAVLDVDIPSNRPDCLGHRGLAREMAVALGSRLPASRLPSAPPPDARAGALPVEIEDPSLCRRYSAVCVGGLGATASPGWMKKRLERSGIRPRSLIVDITNFVMLESGQPLHAFDRDRLRGGRLLVRRARRAEKLTTLDGVERRLEEGPLVIADAEGPVALAGVMGGFDSEIREATKQVVIESACFDPASVRRAARALGLRTEASHRFERGVDPGGCLAAAERAAGLMEELGGGRRSGGATDLYPGQRPLLRLALRLDRLRSLLGIEVESGEARSILERLEFGVTGSDGAAFEVEVPSFRLDITCEEDLIEEVARHFGYDRIPSTLPPAIEQDPGAAVAASERQVALGLALQAHGFTETLSTVFVRGAVSAPFAERGDQPVRLLNPLSDTESELRGSLLPGLLAAVRLNLNRGAAGAALYEIGVVFRGRGGPEPPVEEERLALAASGVSAPPRWDGRRGSPDVFDLKGALEVALERCGWPELRAEAAEHRALLPGRSARLTCAGENLGHLGQIHPAVTALFEVDSPILVAEISLAALERISPTPRRFKALPRTPSVSRDLALVVPRRQAYAEVAEVIRSLDPRIARVEVFDRYESAQMGSDRIGVGLHVVYHHAERTLVSEEVEELERRILQRLQERFGITLRKF